MRTKLSLLFGLLVLVFAVTGCGPGDGSDVPVIGQAGDYKKALDEAEKLSKAPLEKAAKDEDLTEAEKTDLTKAANLFEGLRMYEPDKFAPYLALGMINRALGNPEMAEKCLRQCLITIPASNDDAIKQTSAEAHYQLSRTLFDQGKYDEALAEASTAIQGMDNNPNYLVARASALTQLKRKDEALKELTLAMKLDPENRRGKGLVSLLKP